MLAKSPADRVTAELVVTLGDQDAGVLTEPLTAEEGGGEAAQAAAHDHEVVLLAEVLAGRERLAPARQVVRRLVRAGMGAEQAGEGRGIVPICR